MLNLVASWNYPPHQKCIHYLSLLVGLVTLCASLLLVIWQEVMWSVHILPTLKTWLPWTVRLLWRWTMILLRSQLSILRTLRWRNDRCFSKNENRSAIWSTDVPITGGDEIQNVGSLLPQRCLTAAIVTTNKAKSEWSSRKRIGKKLSQELWEASEEVPWFSSSRSGIRNLPMCSMEQLVHEICVKYGVKMGVFLWQMQVH